MNKINKRWFNEVDKQLGILANFADKTADERPDVHGAIDEIALFIDAVRKEKGLPTLYTPND